MRHAAGGERPASNALKGIGFIRPGVQPIELGPVLVLASAAVWGYVLILIKSIPQAARHRHDPHLDASAPKQGEHDMKELESDVIVVGAGNAAMCAALAAREKGARVVVLEAAPEAESGGTAASPRERCGSCSTASATSSR